MGTGLKILRSPSTILTHPLRLLVLSDLVDRGEDLTASVKGREWPSSDDEIFQGE